MTQEKENQCLCKNDRYCAIMQVVDEKIYGFGSLSEYPCTKPCKILEKLREKLSKR